MTISLRRRSPAEASRAQAATREQTVAALVPRAPEQKEPAHNRHRPMRMVCPV